MNGVAEAAHDREMTAHSPIAPAQPGPVMMAVQSLQAAGVLLIMLGDIAALLIAAGLALAVRLQRHEFRFSVQPRATASPGRVGEPGREEELPRCRLQKWTGGKVCRRENRGSTEGTRKA